ncbi:site-2 protease family protein [Roseovarius sp. 2305UL8-3]|uniref:site-2 protease family protein n=1 Tax=Roseovarius conchicola TaxID=3121636 RepID=UPI003529B9BF
MFKDTTPIYEFRGPYGIPIQIGGSLLMLIAFYVMMSGGDLLWTATFIAMLLIAILLHELGHAWACEVQGVPVRRVVLYGGGGFCERARSASAWQQEFIVAMGPIVNIALWAGCSLMSEGLWLWIIADAAALENPETLFYGPRAEIAMLLEQFAYVNGFLAVFNLIPVQPLDGGKLLHLMLLRLVNPHTALVVTGAIGLALSIIWIPAMLLAYGAGWWILFFIPSVPQHWAMMKGQLA